MAGTHSCPNCHGEFDGRGYGGYCCGKCETEAKRVKDFASTYFNREGFPNGRSSKSV